MDECEALSTRLAIMSKGQIRCIGEVTTLKALYGQGYSVFLKISINTNKEDKRLLEEAMKNAFGPGCDLVEDHLVSPCPLVVALVMIIL